MRQTPAGCRESSRIPSPDWSRSDPVFPDRRSGGLRNVLLRVNDPDFQEDIYPGGRGAVSNRTVLVKRNPDTKNSRVGNDRPWRTPRVARLPSKQDWFPVWMFCPLSWLSGHTDQLWLGVGFILKMLNQHWIKVILDGISCVTRPQWKITLSPSGIEVTH